MKNFNILFKTDVLQIVYEQEEAYLIDQFGNQLINDDFYGTPNCGFISSNNDWAIIGGDHITVWKKEVDHKLRNNNINWIYDIRLKDENLVEFVTDPWSDISAIWELNITTMKYTKIRAFNKYQHKKYTDFVEWQ
ncbi:hypothetical protein [Tenacibaculum sp. M341]|uniref:hypothetical protein n=1 Tax=Tenacibaculum sp. M341 TaxID=2530339 RepID=UPI00104B11B5|nr:hypothetical protein [Tenacibaculum sp. M341]TCI84713.1 hypothetical protein EYW44_19940 [Tenacibaculum sp. M341]